MWKAWPHLWEEATEAGGEPDARPPGPCQGQRHLPTQQAEGLPGRPHCPVRRLRALSSQF